MGEQIVGQERKVPMPLMITDGSDTKPSDSLLPSVSEEGDFVPENDLMRKQDKEVAHSASLSLPKGSDSGETHMTVKRAKALTKTDRNELRSVAWALSGEALGRLDDEVFLWFIRQQISIDDQLDTLVNDRYRRNKEVPEFFHEVMMTLQCIVDSVAERKGITFTKEENDNALRWLYLIFIIGAYSVKVEMFKREEKRDGQQSC